MYCRHHDVGPELELTIYFFACMCILYVYIYRCVHVQYIYIRMLHNWFWLLVAVCRMPNSLLPYSIACGGARFRDCIWLCGVGLKALRFCCLGAQPLSNPEP